MNSSQPGQDMPAEAPASASVPVGAPELEGIAFAGQTLGPLFRFDPKLESAAIAPTYRALAGMDARDVASEWPFVEEGQAFGALTLMQEGLAGECGAGDAWECDDELAWEYRRLFVGPGPKAAPPWGSVYTDKDAVMFGGTWIALREFLRANGIVVGDGSGKMPEDHIGLMLELMAYLASERPELLPDYLRLHLLTWAPHFLDTMERESRHPFFTGLAQLTRASLQGIQAQMGLSVEVPRFFR